MFRQVLMANEILKENEGNKEDWDKICEIENISIESSKYIEMQKKKKEEGKIKASDDVFFSIGGDIDDEDGVIVRGNLAKARIITQNESVALSGAGKKNLYMTMMKFALLGPNVDSFESGDELAEYIKSMFEKIVDRYEDLIMKDYENDRDLVDQDDIEVVALSQLYDKSFGMFDKMKENMGAYSLNSVFSIAISELIANKYSKNKNLAEILQKSQVVKKLESGLAYCINEEKKQLRTFYEIDSGDIKRTIKGVPNRDEAKIYLESISKEEKQKE